MEMYHSYGVFISVVNTGFGLPEISLETYVSCKENVTPSSMCPYACVCRVGIFW